MAGLSAAKLKVFGGKQNFSLIKPKKKKKPFGESLDQCQRLEVREKARNVFGDQPTSIRPQTVTQHRIFISFFLFRSDFLAFFACISYIKFLEFKEFNKTIIPFALVGYETGYSLLILPSHIQRALME